MTDPIGNCILAGVNGAGKSTLYEALNELKGMPRINTDEIVKERVKIRINRVDMEFQKKILKDVM